MKAKFVRLGDLVEEFSVRAKSIDHEAYLNFYGVSNEEGITISKYAAEDKSEEYKMVEQGCFAYNPYRVNVGSIAFFTKDKPGLISPAYIVFKTKPNSVIPELLLKFLKSTEGKRQIKMYARGTVRQALRFEDLCKIGISLPPYDEQIKLYKDLYSIHVECDKLSYEQDHQLHLLKKLRQQILQDAVMGKLVPQDFNDEPASVLLERIKVEKKQLVREKKIRQEKPMSAIKAEKIPFDIPENWVWCRLGEIALHSEAGKSYQAMDVSAKRNQIGVIKTSAITSGCFLEDENKLLPIQNESIEKIKIGKHDIIFCRASGSKELAGKSCLVMRSPNAQLILSDKSVRYIFSDNISKQFIQNFNSSNFATQYYQKLGTGKSTSMNNITREQFNYLLIPLPPLQEQHRIVTKVEQLMAQCDEYEQTIKQNQNYTRQLLQVALKEALEPE